MLLLVITSFGVAPASAQSVSDENTFINAINQVRQGQGLPALQRDTQLRNLARSWTASQQNGECGGGAFICHADPISQGVTHNWQKLGENVGTGPNVDDVMAAFIASPGHYKNIIDPDFTHIGVGVSWDGNRLYTTHRFMTLRNSAPATTAAPRTTTTTAAPRTTTTAAPRTTTTAAPRTTTTAAPRTTTTAAPRRTTTTTAAPRTTTTAAPRTTTTAAPRQTTNPASNTSTSNNNPATSNNNPANNAGTSNNGTTSNNAGTANNGTTQSNAGTANNGIAQGNSSNQTGSNGTAPGIAPGALAQIDGAGSQTTDGSLSASDIRLQRVSVILFALDSLR